MIPGQIFWGMNEVELLSWQADSRNFVSAFFRRNWTPL